MRAIVAHILAVLLIAVFVIGSPPPAKADCAQCQDCSTEIPAKNNTPCPEKGLACQVAQTCANQVQKAPGHINSEDRFVAAQADFGFGASIAIKSAYLTPETAPPRA